MEAVGALGRGSRNLSSFLESIRAAVRARSRAFWIVAGLTLAAAVLRFATLGTQAYHHDEIVTASRVLRDGFGHAMEAVGFSESAPPLYYVLAWLWTQVTGTGELGLRSLSALAGVATVPVAYLLGREANGKRTGLLAAALVAVNPMLLWYSQEARSYSLLVLLTTLATLHFLRALDVPSQRGRYGYLSDGTSARHRDLVLWGAFSALALATHYFAIFAIALEGGWLLWRRGRDAWPGVGIVLLVGLALTPLVVHQTSLGHAEWIGGHSLGHRLWEVAATFVVGETGDIVARPETVLPAVVPLVALAAALALLALRGDRSERRAGGTLLALVGATTLVPLALALLVPGKDYVLARNLLPALVPLLVAVAIGLTLRAARRAGAIAAAVLVVYSLGFSVFVSVSPAWQRPDWNAVAARLGEPKTPRAIVLWTLGEASLRWYLSTGAFQVQPADGYAWTVHEVEFVSDGPAPPVPARLVGPRFRQVSYEKAGRLHIRRYALPGPDLAPLRIGRLREADLGWRSNGVMLDGIGTS